MRIVDSCTWIIVTKWQNAPIMFSVNNSKADCNMRNDKDLLIKLKDRCWNLPESKKNRMISEKVKKLCKIYKKEQLSDL